VTPDNGRSPQGHLLQVLGVAFGIAVIVGNSIGMGILRTPGEVAARLPDTGLFLAVWVAGGLYALVGALSLAELGAMLPRSGGQYAFVRHALGPFPAFVVGWSDWISTCGSAAAIALVLAQYVGPSTGPLAGREAALAAAVVLFFAALQWLGIRVGDAVQQGTSLLKTLALLALAAAALFVAPAAAPATAAATAAVVPSGLALAAAVVVALQSAIYTYDGWTGPIYFGEEVRDPGRDIPRAMIGGVLLVTGVYLALNLAFLRVVPVAEMAGDPFVAATAAARLFGPGADLVLRALMAVSLLAAVNACLLMGSRVPFAMGRDRQLPAALAAVNAGGTPTVALALSTLVALGFIATNTFDAVLALLAFFFVAAYALSFLSVIVLRRREPGRARPFRVPLYPWLTGAALFGSLAFLAAAVAGDRENSGRALLLLLCSGPVYLLLRRALTGAPPGGTVPPRP
jgi:APA family basic amino acid/polyamine antiporter